MFAEHRESDRQLNQINQQIYQTIGNELISITLPSPIAHAIFLLLLEKSQSNKFNKKSLKNFEDTINLFLDEILINHPQAEELYNKLYELFITR